MPDSVVARAPARVDLAGGTLDIWPLYLLHPGAMTVNLAVTLHARAEVRPLPSGVAVASADRGVEASAPSAAAVAEKAPELRLAARLIEALAPDRPLELRLHAAAPAHAGLGGSSTVAVAAAAALDRFAGGGRSREQLLDLVQDVETAVIEVPTGRQDYVPALWGGLQALHWRPGGLVREVLPPAAVAERLVLCTTGAPRFSGANNWEVFKRRIEGDRETRARLDGIRAAAGALREAIARADADGIDRAVRAEWEERRALLPAITTPAIDALGEQAVRAGATAFKVCGAGGGGAVFALCPPERRPAVAAALVAGGGTVLAVAADTEGLVVSGREEGRT